MVHIRICAIDHIVVNVSDVERSLDWYCGLLGLTAEKVEEWRAGDAPFPSVRVNDGFIIDLLSRARTGENCDHFCLVVENEDMEAIASDERFIVIAGPVVRGGARGDGRSVYVRDPDGNTVELRTYTRTVLVLVRFSPVRTCQTLTRTLTGRLARLWRRRSCPGPPTIG